MRIDRRVCFIVTLGYNLLLIFIYNFVINKQQTVTTKTKANVNSSKETILINEVVFDSAFNFTATDLLKIIYLKSECDCRKSEIIALYKYKTHFKVDLINSNLNKVTHLFNFTYEEFSEFNLTCNLYKTLRRGKSQKVLAYSLYETNKAYYNKIANITSQIKKLYPEWLMRVYYDSSIDKSIICQIECAQDDRGNLIDNADFCNVDSGILLKPVYLESLDEEAQFNSLYVHPTEWRFLTIGDSFVSVFSSRDIDSYILQREVDSVQVWLSSDKVGHIIRDNPNHDTEILAGMWGFYNHRDPDLAKKIFNLILNKKVKKRLTERDKYKNLGGDQRFLSKRVYPLIRGNSIVHDSFFCAKYGGRPFPTKRVGDCFVGSREGCNLNAEFFRDCPFECRPKNATHWNKC